MAEEDRTTSLLITRFANLLSDQGKLGEAEPLYREALEGRRAKLSADRPNTRHSMHDLAHTLSNQCKLDAAESLNREALVEGNLADLGTDYSDTLTSMDNLA
ncbi:hypothetical protein CYMTET_26106 [Cymbomonas tetramitiformis]|uniref:Tetratricopeptide repeat protein n=1 Tax=Cymbomonas tetramitiformis TaxID=36881 RepID=A0AAE0FSF9_9CHLO|nr:hypothetical protein CYMTET_26106 [Cymbomonas tetramitiformis]|eukprot:gene17692-21078_t